MQNINFVKKCNNNFLHNVCGSIELKPQKKIETICIRLDIDKTVIYGTRILFYLEKTNAGWKEVAARNPPMGARQIR
jgi:hypothetical protein